MGQLLSFQHLPKVEGSWEDKLDCMGVPTESTARVTRRPQALSLPRERGAEAGLGGAAPALRLAQSWEPEEVEELQLSP